MANEYGITTASNHLILKDQGRGEVVFTVSNLSGREFTGRGQLEMLGSNNHQWFTLVGEPERTFAIGGIQQYVVQISVPTNAPAGNYLFRLDMIGKQIPDDQISQGPTVTFEVAAASPKKFPWWIVILVVALLAVGAMVIALVALNREVEVPDVAGLSQSAATTILEEAGLVVNGVRTENSPDVPAGQVIGSDPAGGSHLDKKTPVTLIVSSGPVIPTATPTPAPTATPTAVPGAWDGLWLIQCDLLPCTTMTITQNGNNVTASFDDGNGQIQGTINGNRLSGSLSLFGASSTIEFWLDNSGTFWQGNWNRTLNWCGYRNGGSVPTPCGLASWAGSWLTNCDADCGTMLLFQNSTHVFGNYAGGGGQVDGTVNGTLFSGTWTRNNTSGPFEFFMVAEGEGRQFNGNYDNDFGWCGSREGAGLPTPCEYGSGPVFVVTLRPLIPNDFLEVMPFLISTATPTP